MFSLHRNYSKLPDDTKVYNAAVQHLFLNAPPTTGRGLATLRLRTVQASFPLLFPPPLTTQLTPPYFPPALP